MATRKLGSVKATDVLLVNSVDLAAEITGILGPANGGTGQSTWTNGQLPIGNTTGNTLTKATLTPGSNIAITNGNGAITIAAFTATQSANQLFAGPASGSAAAPGFRSSVEADLVIASLLLGFEFERTGNAQFTFKPGIAAIPSTGQLIKSSSDIVVNVSSPSASTWYYFYLYNNSGAAAIEASTTAPTAYLGPAKQKTSDASRRFVGCGKTDASSNFYACKLTGDHFKWMLSTGASPFRVLAGGTATTFTTVGTSAVVPDAGVNLIDVRFNNYNPGNTIAYLYYAVGGQELAAINPDRDAFFWGPIDSSRNFQYGYTFSAPASGGAYADVYGFKLMR